MTGEPDRPPPRAAGDRRTIAVVVPSFDGSHLLPACIGSLLAQTRKADEIIVVDDASTDDSRERLARDFPAVRVVALPKNRGFPGAVNAGIAAARCDDVVLLNNDAVAEPAFLAALEAAAGAHPDVGAFACRMLKATREGPIVPPRIDSAGLALARGFAQLSRGDGEPDGERFAAEREVLGACGGAAMWRKERLDDLGGFDERFHAYFEDYDLALRHLLRGGVTLYVPEARVHHLGSATLGKRRSRGTYLYARNSLLVLGTAVPLRAYLRECVLVEWRCVRMLALAALVGRFLVCLAGLFVGKLLFARELLRRSRAPLHCDSRAVARLRAFVEEGERERGENRRLRVGAR